jgi:hypothetical protein
LSYYRTCSQVLARAVISKKIMQRENMKMSRFSSRAYHEWVVVEIGEDDGVVSEQVERVLAEFESNRIS